MRTKVKLYIEGLQADLDESSFLLLNYTAEDLSNPTVVKNSFSRQITLKGTANNDAIFGNIYRNDRNTVYGSPYTGPNFDPTRKTSFVIYNELSALLFYSVQSCARHLEDILSVDSDEIIYIAKK